jgi:hypothetical protein
MDRIDNMLNGLGIRSDDDQPANEKDWSDIDDDDLPPPSTLEAVVRPDPKTNQERLLGLGTIRRELSPVRRRIADEAFDDDERLRDDSPMSRPRHYNFEEEDYADNDNANGEREAGMEPGVDIENYVPCAYETYRFPLTAEERAATQRPRYCFLCDIGQTAEEAMSNPRVEKLITYLYNNFHNTKPLTLATKAQGIYNRSIRTLPPGTPVWRREIIYEHVTQHHPAPRIIVEDNIRTLNHVRMTLRDNGVFKQDERNKNSKFKIDAASLKMYMMVLQQQRVLLREADIMRTNATIHKKGANASTSTM